MRNNLINQINQYKPKVLTRDEVRICFKIIRNMPIKGVAISGKELSEKTGLTPVNLREHIMLIRRQMVTKFQNPTGEYFITADRDGYRLTRNRKYLTSYLHTLEARQSSISLQILELTLAINNNK